MGHSSLPDASWGCRFDSLGLWPQTNADKVLLWAFINHLHHLSKHRVLQRCRNVLSSHMRRLRCDGPPQQQQEQQWWWRRLDVAKLSVKLLPAALGRRGAFDLN